MAGFFDATSRYEVEDELGKGGMGAVYRVRDRVLDRPAALKVIIGAASEEALERFVREARAGAGLEHPALVPTYDVGRCGRELFFTMQLVEGRTLAEALAEPGHPISRPVRWLAAAARGVAYAHQRGLVHRDLKPANIMVGAGGGVSVLDWGLVAPGTTTLTSGASASDLDGDARLTLDGALMGTPAYMSPEQAEGKGAQAGPACDVYALGAILYEILAGVPPVVLGTIRQMVEQVARGQFVPPSQRAAPGREVPLALEAVAAHAMAKDPAARYRDAGELASDLEAWLEGRAVSVQPLPWTARAMGWVSAHPVAVAAALALIVVAAASWAIASDLARRERARIDSYRDADVDRWAKSLDDGRDAAGRARIGVDSWKTAFAEWRTLALADNTTLISRPTLSPIERAETLDAYYQRTSRAMQSGVDWDVLLALEGRRGNPVDPARSMLLYAEVLHKREAWRRDADEARQLLERAGPLGELPGEALEALVRLADAGLEIDIEIAMANEHDWLNPETLAASILTRQWRTWTGDEQDLAADLPPVWRNVLRAMRHSAHAHELASRHADRDRLADIGRARRERVAALLDGSESVAIDPMPAGVAGELFRATSDPLWARVEEDRLVPDELAGLERVGGLDPLGSRLTLPAGEYLLRMSRDQAVVRQWFLVERGVVTSVVPSFPARFPPEAVLVAAAPVALRGFDVTLAPSRARVGPFFVERTETPVSRYRAFLDAVIPRGEAPAWILPKSGGQPQLVRGAGGAWVLGPGTADDHPVSCLSYLAGALYARWRSEREGWAWRLPSHAEWTLAAGGPGSRTYPWGSMADKRRASCAEGGARLVSVESLPEGRSPYGLHHMSGNVWEVLATPLDPDFIIKMGGDYAASIGGTTVQRMDRSAIGAFYQECGIRLVCDLPASPPR